MPPHLGNAGFYETLYEYQPDMLLFLDGHNDFYNVDPANPIKAYGYSAAGMVRAVNERRPLLTMYLSSRYLGQYSYAFKFLEQVSLQLFERHEAPPHNSSQSARLPDGDFGTALEAAATIGFLRNYRLIEHFARAAGIDYHVFLQPEVVFENDHRLHQPDRAIKATTEKLYGPERVELMKRARVFPRSSPGTGFLTPTWGRLPMAPPSRPSCISTTAI